MTEQLDHHDAQEHPCVVCHAMVNTIAALRLALLNATTERDAAHAEVAELWQSAMSRYVVDENGCWNWTGAISPGTQGYGRLWLSGRYLPAHRASYEYHRGHVPADLVIDHLCRNRACVNPDHMEPVTNAENVARGIGITAQNSRKTQCPAGHDYSGGNLIINYQGKRVCRTCAKRKAQQRNEILSAAAKSLGLTQKQYRRQIGHSVKTARAILAAELNRELVEL